MMGDRRRVRQTGNRLGMGINLRSPRRTVGVVAQRLNAAGRGAGANGDQHAAVGTDLLDAFEVIRRRHAAFDEGNVHFGIRIERPGFGEMHQIDPFGQREQILAEIEQGKLAAIAGAEFVNRYTWPGGVNFRGAHQIPRCASKVFTWPQSNTGPSRQTNAPPNWQ